MGASHEHATVPSPGLGCTNKMTFLERVLNTLGTEVFLLLRKLFLIRMLDDLARKDFPDGRSINEIERDAAICLANIDFATSWTRTLPKTIIPVGAMHVRPAKPLPKVIQIYFGKMS